MIPECVQVPFDCLFGATDLVSDLGYSKPATGSNLFENPSSPSHLVVRVRQPGFYRVTISRYWDIYWVTFVIYWVTFGIYRVTLSSYWVMIGGIYRVSFFVFDFAVTLYFILVELDT